MLVGFDVVGKGIQGSLLYYRYCDGIGYFGAKGKLQVGCEHGALYGA
jgi:hypothetical protein